MSTKASSRKRAAASAESDSEGNVPTKKTKKSSAPNMAMQTDEEGNEFWEISNKRRVQISVFKKNVMVSIREFYEKDGQMRPGQKGISLTVDQFNAVVELLPQIEPVLQAKGADVARPEYGQCVEKQATPAKEDESEDEAEAGGFEPASKAASKLEKYKLKKNHESTSEEDGD